MGKFKRIAVIAVAIVTMFAMTVPAMAATGSQGEGSTAGAATAKMVNTVGNYAKKTIKVKYKGNSDAVKYEIAYKKVGSSKWKYKTTSKKSAYTLSVKKNGLYQIKVRGINKDGKKGSWSKSEKRYVETAKPTVKAKKKSILVKAKKVKGASGYQIRYSTKKSMKGYKKVTVKSKKALKKTIKGLKKGKTYYVQVRPIKKSGGKYYIGISTAKKKVKVK